MTPAGRSVATVWDPDAPAQLPFGSNSVQHGTAVFDGVRCYTTDSGRAVFRLDEHLRRLLRSAELLGVPHDYDLGRVRELVLSAARTPWDGDLYLRPVLFTPQPQLGVDLRRFAFTLVVEVYAMGGPAGSGTVTGQAAAPGVRLTVSPWCRPAATTFPSEVKATGSYVVSALARTAAAAEGFDDAIQLDPVSGRVAEATIANVFLVDDGRLVTPWRRESMLAGITRDSVITLARRLGIDVREAPVEVADLRRAQEVFLSGTAAELVPAVEVDGHRTDPDGPVFRRVADAFDSVVRGRQFQDLSWLTRPVAEPPSGR